MPRVVFISDTHGKHDELTGKIPRCDILIHCGDISTTGRVEQVGSFLYWFDKQPATSKVFLAGNHDWLFERSPRAAQDMVNQYENIEYLNGSLVELEGLEIYAEPSQPAFAGWAFNFPRGKVLADIWSKIPLGIDILVTHCAPYGVLDKTVDGDLTGCEDLLERIKIVKPRYSAFGHIHEAYGQDSIGNTKVYNCSSCDDLYRVVNPPVILEIKPKR